MGKYVAAFGASYLLLVLIKDGTIPGILTDAARTGGDVARGLKPITTAA